MTGAPPAPARTWTAVPCKGARGCGRAGDDDECDDTLAVEGDACPRSPPLDYACATGQMISSTQIPVHGCQLGTEGGTALHAVRLALRWLVSDKIENNFIATDTQDRSEVPALKLLYSNNTQGIIPTGNGSQFVTGPTSYTTYATYNNLGFTDPARYNGKL